MGHRWNPDDYGLSCQDCPSPEGHPVHQAAPTVMTQATRGYRHGDTYDVTVDYERLNAQARRVFGFMVGGAWHTLTEVSVATGDPEASVSARLRDFRKPEFGGIPVERRRREGSNLWEYRVMAPALAQVPAHT